MDNFSCHQKYVQKHKNHAVRNARPKNKIKTIKGDHQKQEKYIIGYLESPLRSLPRCVAIQSISKFLLTCYTSINLKGKPYVRYVLCTPTVSPLNVHVMNTNLINSMPLAAILSLLVLGAISKTYPLHTLVSNQGK